MPDTARCLNARRSTATSLTSTRKPASAASRPRLGVDTLLMTIRATPVENARPASPSRCFSDALNQNYKRRCQAPRPCKARHNTTSNGRDAGAAMTSAVDAELGLLRDILRLLPTGVTVQDEHGRFLLVNDAAAAACRRWPPPRRRLATERSPRNLPRIAARRPRRRHRRSRYRRARPGRYFSTAHRPVRIADRKLLLSSSADISEQKAFEDQLFRSAYYDELTGLPTRRVIEHRVNDSAAARRAREQIRARLSRHR